ncbi:MAG TPA: AIR synthase related protein [Patescibacteria group bacterium]|nr:AIR synthase related protein [Patescibacteria group bacterium]
MKVGGAGEFGLLEHIKPYLSDRAGRDDAAVVGTEAGLLVVSCDMFVENVHFDLGWMSPEDAGWRSLALALGDLAAKGATPLWATVSLAMPATWDVADMVGLYRGMSDLARQVSMEIVGGDMSGIEGPAVLSISLTGRTDRRPLERSQAQAGWSVGVTGPLGAAAVAFRERRPLRLQPRLDAGRRLNGLGLCCGDISDGLVREMEKFAFMAGVGCVLQAADVPLAERASLDDALTGGEESDLVCVGPDGLVAASGLVVVGRLTSSRAVEVVDAAGNPMRLRGTGYDHFA